MIKIILVVTNIMKTLFIIFTTTIAIFLPHTLSSQNRAPSLYLNYQDEGQGDIIINTLRVQSPSPVYTYYCGLLWNSGQDAGGYCGMQEHPNGKNFIYSLWDPISSTDPITAEYTHPDTDIANFGGEGTGLRSMNFGIGWETNQWYSLVSRAWSTNDTSTLFGYWIYDQSSNMWHHLVTMNYPVTDLKFNTKTSSFIEDWLGNGSSARTVQHKNGWKRKTSDASWLPFEESYFDRVFPDAGTVNYIENYDGGAIDDEYYFMTSGGTTTPETNEDDVTLNLTYNTTSPGFETGEFNNLTLVVDNNNLLVNWDVIDSKSPQFSYHLKIYDNVELSGSSIISIDKIKPHLRNDIIDISNLSDNSEYFVQFYITDIFDNVSVNEVKSIQTALSQVGEIFDKPVYMHYMPWFDSPDYNNNWGIHWKMANKNPDVIIDEITGKREIASHYYPLIGPYDSQDPDVIEYHLLLMKYSGIDGVLINWYGKVGTNGDIDVLLENSNAIVNASDALNMDFSVIMEDRFVGNENSLNPVDYVHINIEYLKNNYFTKNNFIRTNTGKPLFGIFGPIEIFGESDWNYALTAAGEEVIFLPLYWSINKVGAGASGGYDWVLENGISANNSFYQSTAPSLDFAMGCAYPGFKDFYAEGAWGDNLFYLDHNDGVLLNQTLDLAIENKATVDALQLVTWNDFGEGTMFEPTYEFGFKMLTNLQAKLGVPYSEYELQQIYRLFKLRKTHSNNQSIQNILNQSRDYFVNYQTSDAIALLDDIEGINDEELYYIKNRFNNSYLYQDGEIVKYSLETNNDTFKWKLVLAGNGYYYLENAFSGDKMHIENQTSSLECTSIALNSLSSIWEKRTVNGTHSRLLNMSTSNQFINIENDLGYAEYSSINSSWESAQWTLEEAPNILSLYEIAVKNVSIFPNPTNDIVTIKGLNNISNLTVYDVQGKQIKIEDIITTFNNLKFSIKNFKSGVYFVKIENNLGTTTLKLIVEY